MRLPSNRIKCRPGVLGVLVVGPEVDSARFVLRFDSLAKGASAKRFVINDSRDCINNSYDRASVG